MKNKRSRSKSSPINRRSILMLVALLVIIGGGSYAYKRHQDNSKSAAAAAKTTAIQSNTPDTTNQKVDLTPATPADRQDIDSQKESNNPNGTTSTGTSTAQITLTNVSKASGTIHVGTMLSGTTSGTCIATFTNKSSGKTYTGTSSVTAQVDGNYSCGALDLSQASVPSGTYDVSATLNVGGTIVSSNVLSGVQI